MARTILSPPPVVTGTWKEAWEIRDPDKNRVLRAFHRENTTVPTTSGDQGMLGAQHPNAGNPAWWHTSHSSTWEAKARGRPRSQNHQKGGGVTAQLVGSSLRMGCLLSMDEALGSVPRRIRSTGHPWAERVV